MNYKTIEIDGDKYIKVNNRWLDSSFIVPPINITRKIISHELSQIDLDTISIAHTKIILDEAKKAECYDICLELSEKLIKKALLQNDMDTVKYYLSAKTSALRHLGKSTEAIEYCKEMEKEYGKDILAVAALTSLAAAYCDTEEWDKAKSICNNAYRKQGGSVGYNNELSMVYKRIKANNK